MPKKSSGRSSSTKTEESPDFRDAKRLGKQIVVAIEAGKRRPGEPGIWLEEAALWRQLGLLETGVETSRKLIEALPADQRTGTDIDLIRKDVKLRDLGEAWLRAGGANTKQKARELVEKTLKGNARKRRELLSATLAKMKSPRSYPGPPKPKG